MSLRIVVYAEGLRETGGAERVALAPGDDIPPDALGPAHILVQRCLARDRGIPMQAITFSEPLRVKSARARGSHLADPRTLRQLLTWLKPPDLAVVLVDRDGQRQRDSNLRKAIEGLEQSAPTVIGVAVEEIEAWFAADGRSVAKVAGAASFQVDEDLESLSPREAKRRLEDCLHDGAVDVTAQRARRCELARTVDLAIVTKRCTSFAAFVAELRNLPIDKLSRST